MQPLETMRERLQRIVCEDAEREDSATRCAAQATAMGAQLHLVHRTVAPGGATLEDILSAGCLLARKPCTQREIDCGIPRAVYFFLGCAAFPEGVVAFLVRNQLLDATAGSFSPFDTGSLEKHARPRDEHQAWRGPDKLVFLESHLGHGSDALDFTADYVAAHFKHPSDYVRRLQHSIPDFGTYHGLESTSGDRRAWSIEIQLHEDLALDDEHVETIVLGSPDLLSDFPDELVGKIVLTEDGSVVSTVQGLILAEAFS